MRYTISVPVTASTISLFIYRTENMSKYNNNNNYDINHEDVKRKLKILIHKWIVFSLSQFYNGGLNIITY